MHKETMTVDETKNYAGVAPFGPGVGYFVSNYVRT